MSVRFVLLVVVSFKLLYIDFLQLWLFDYNIYFIFFLYNFGCLRDRVGEVQIGEFIKKGKDLFKVVIGLLGQVCYWDLEKFFNLSGFFRSLSIGFVFMSVLFFKG